MKIKEIVFTDVNKAELLEREVSDSDIAELPENKVLIRTVVSTISPGTERANITGDANVNAGAAPAPGSMFPRKTGYSSAGVVEAVGAGVTEITVGDRVAVYWGNHKSYNLVPQEYVVKLKDPGVSFETAAMSFIASFSMAAIRKTRLEIGESAMVMGLGILGMFSVKLLRAAGAFPIIAVDPKAERRKVALRSGADYAFDPFEEGFAEKVRQITGKGVNVAIEVTGVGAGLNETLDCMAKFGRVALLGCTRNSDFSVDYYKKIHSPGITLIGAHTIARPEVESRPGCFTHRDDMEAILNLCAGGRLSLEDLLEETYTPEACEEVYRRLVCDNTFPVAVQFDWRTADEKSQSCTDRNQ